MLTSCGDAVTDGSVQLGAVEVGDTEVPTGSVGQMLSDRGGTDPAVAEQLAEGSCAGEHRDVAVAFGGGRDVAALGVDGRLDVGGDPAAGHRKRRGPARLRRW